MRRALKNLLFSVLTAVLLLGGAELTLRLLGWPDPGIYAGDINSVWWLRANLDRELPFPEEGTTFTVQTNALGFRGDPTPHAIACVGDSTTFGWGVAVDEAWPARLAQHLGQPTLNAGVPGYSSHQGLHTVARLLAAEPDTVVLAFLVRDAQLGARADHLSRPAPSRPRLLDALTVLVRRDAPSTPPSAVRVPADRFRENLVAMTEQLTDAGIEVRLLGFPMLDPPEAHIEVLRELDATVVSLDRANFFEHDPIHLNAKGHDNLARLVAETWDP